MPVSATASSIHRRDLLQELTGALERACLYPHHHLAHRERLSPHIITIKLGRAARRVHALPAQGPL